MMIDWILKKYGKYLPKCSDQRNKIKFAQIGLIKRVGYQDQIIEIVKKDKINFIFFGLKKENINLIINKGIFPHNSYISILLKYGLVFYIFFFYLIYTVISKNNNYFTILFLIMFCLSQIFDDYLLGNRSDLTFIFWYLLAITFSYTNLEENKKN